VEEDYVEGREGGSAAGEPVLWIIVSHGWHDPSLALRTHCSKLLSTKLFAGRADQGAGVEPVILDEPHLYFLARVEAGEGVVEHLHV
jgi:hypothetical protein